MTQWYLGAFVNELRQKGTKENRASGAPLTIPPRRQPTLPVTKVIPPMGCKLLNARE